MAANLPRKSLRACTQGASLSVGFNLAAASDDGRPSHDAGGVAPLARRHDTAPAHSAGSIPGIRRHDSVGSAAASAAVAMAAADAARKAVAAAFAELQPALVQAVVAASGQQQQQQPGSEGPHMPAGPRFARRGSRLLLGLGDLIGDGPSRVSRNQVRGGSARPTAGEYLSEDSEEHSQLSPSPDLPFLSPPTVQSLQAQIANSLLESAYVVRSGEHSRRTSLSSVRKTVSDLELHSSKLNLRIVPAPEEEPAPLPGESKSEASNADQPRDRGNAPLAKQDEDGKSDVTSDDSDREQARPGARSMSLASRSTGKLMSSNQVLKARIHELAKEASQGAGSTADFESEARGSKGWVFCLGPRVAPIGLFVFGILPWDRANRPWTSAAYQWCVRGLMLLSVVTFLLPSVVELPESLVLMNVLLPQCRERNALCWEREGLLSQLPLPAGATLALLPFGLQRHQMMLEETFTMLCSVSLERSFRDWHMRQARRDRAMFLLLWWSIILLGGLSKYVSSRSGAELLSMHVTVYVLLVAMFSGVILSVAHAMVYVCRSLIVMLDAFCCDVVGQLALDEIGHVWNLTQAVLRKASTAVENCLLALCVVLAFTVPLLVVDVAILGGPSASFTTVLPGFLVTCGILYVLFLAATISEKCACIPSLVNAISFGPGTDYARHHIVEYIKNSAAGFYVFSMRLTTSMVLKLMYVWCIVAVGQFTRLDASGQGVAQ